MPTNAFLKSGAGVKGLDRVWPESPDRHSRATACCYVNDSAGARRAPLFTPKSAKTLEIVWFLILFCVAIFILFIPVEFLNTFKIYNISFKDLLTNVILVIFTSLSFLVIFQFFLSPSNQIISDIIDLGKAVSFSGFITVPLILFVVHNLTRRINFSEKFSYGFTLFVWVMSSQLFL